MKSVYAKIVLWCFGLLVLSLAAVAIISVSVSLRPPGKEMFAGINALQVAEAEDAYQSGGVPAVSAYLDKLRKYLPGQRYFIDAQGRDIITGTDRSTLLAQATRGWHHGKDGVVFARTSHDGRFRLVWVHAFPFDFGSAIPYYLLVMAAIAGLCWLLAVNIASPLQALARTVDRFGRGELSLRVRSRRRDEIGDLSRSFDQMAERIETLLTAERRLLQDISHELRSPLARLSFAAELTKTAQDRNAAAARLQKEITRLTSLVSALLEMTRLEADPAARRTDKIEITPLLEELLEDCRLEAEAHGCRMVLEPPAESTVVEGDCELLRRAIENVLRNAMRYAPEGTAIETRLETTGNSLRITIRDYGPGVPEESLSKIFTPFFRIDPSRDKSTGGAGLGLAIAQRAVSLHDGHLSAWNAEPGLAVCIELPRMPPEE